MLFIRNSIGWRLLSCSSSRSANVQQQHSFSKKSSSDQTKTFAVVGLGNPGAGFVGTRHNVGFEVVDKMADKFNCQLKLSSDGLYEWGFCEPTSTTLLLLCKPTTFMNLSGIAFKELVKKHSLDLSNSLVVCDQMDLEVGKIRLKPHGSSGGQKGLQDCIQRIGTNSFPRLFFGVGKPSPGIPVPVYITGKFKKEEKSDVLKGTRTAICAIELWIKHGIDQAMNSVNGASVVPPKPKQKTSGSTNGENAANTV